MAYLSRWDLEQIAYRVTQAYARKVGVQYADLERIVPETIMQDMLGLRIQYEQLSLDGKTLGITCFDETEIGVYDGDQEGDMVLLDGKTVLIEKGLLYYDKTGRRNFTLLHEAGHHILHMLFPKEYATDSAARTVRYYRDQKTDGFNPLEWQCDTLAAAILMPSELVRRQCAAHGITKRIKTVNGVNYREERKAFCAVSESLGASLQALAIRMRQLGLLEDSRLEKPQNIMDIVVGDDEYYANADKSKC